MPGRVVKGGTSWTDYAVYLKGKEEGAVAVDEVKRRTFTSCRAVSQVSKSPNPNRLLDCQDFSLRNERSSD